MTYSRPIPVYQDSGNSQRPLDSSDPGTVPSVSEAFANLGHAIGGITRVGAALAGSAIFIPLGTVAGLAHASIDYMEDSGALSLLIEVHLVALAIASLRR